MNERHDGGGSGTAAMELLVSGRVQGVGFRHFVAIHARESGLRGYVRNLPDGRVAVVAEGGVAALDRLHDVVQRGPAGGRVSGVTRSDGTATGSFADFQVRF